MSLYANLDKKIDQFFEPLADATASIVFYSVPLGGLDVKLILLWLVAAALFFTFYMGFANIRYFRHACDLICKPAKSKKGSKKAVGEVSRFQALAASLSGTVGLGNIAGVAVAVSIGGAGAAFWMVLMGIMSMTTKFAEVSMGVKYRKKTGSGKNLKISGGPMYYLGHAFESRGIPHVGPIVAAIFAFCCVIGSIGAGNMFQANQAYTQVMNVTGGAEGFLADKGWLFGLGLAVLVGLVIIGGIKSIGNVAGKLVPTMGGIYIVTGLLVLAVNYQNIPMAFHKIITEAFNPMAGVGGLMGALLVGVQRAAFSNEAGLGSAAIVHSTAQTDDHISQGFVSMLGPVIDTVVICLITALVIVVSGVPTGDAGVQGVGLTSAAMETGASWFPYVLTLTVFLFAYSTLITWFYYGLKGLTYLFGDNPVIEMSFKILFLGCVVIGSASELSSIINFADAAILSLAIPNLIGLYLMAPEIKRDLKDYVSKNKL